MDFELTRIGEYDSFWCARLSDDSLRIETGGYHSHRPLPTTLSNSQLAELESTISELLLLIAGSPNPPADVAWLWDITCLIESKTHTYRIHAQQDDVLPRVEALRSLMLATVPVS